MFLQLSKLALRAFRSVSGASSASTVAVDVPLLDLLFFRPTESPLEGPGRRSF